MNLLFHSLVATHALYITNWNTLDALIAMILLIEITFTGSKKVYKYKNHNSDTDDDEACSSYVICKSDEKLSIMQWWTMEHIISLNLTDFKEFENTWHWIEILRSNEYY